jgi:hypothetical protein
MNDYQQAQIALINEMSWAVIGPYWRYSGMNDIEMPIVACPIVDTRPVAWPVVEKIVKRHIEIEGIQNVDLFITELLNVGCALAIPVAIHEFSVSIPARV